MSNKRTFTIIKPDAMQNLYAGAIINDILHSGFRIIGLKQLHLSEELAKRFYAVHRERAFFQELINFMCEGPIIVAVLEKNNAVAEFRKLIGATNPLEAEPETLRAKYGTNVERNAIHGSDSDPNASIEINFFFANIELT